MAEAPGIVVTYRFTYRGSDEEWSQKYHHDGTAPSSPSAWRDWCDVFTIAVRNVLGTQVHIVRYNCYEDLSAPTTYTYNLADWAGEIAGEWAPSSGEDWASGDTAYLERWNTGRMSSKGKPVYLFKYFHPAGILEATPDDLAPTLKTVMDTFGAALETGLSSGLKIADKNGNAVTGYHTEPYATTRTLKRRGRRPT